MTLNNIGWCHAQLGDYERTLEFCEQALPLLQEAGELRAQAYVWDLGFAHQHLGDDDQAVTCYENALTISRELGERLSEAKVLTNLGDAHAAADRSPAARQAWRQALTIFDNLRHPSADQVRAKLAVAARPVRPEPALRNVSRPRCRRLPGPVSP
jgi:tetratricopeptide (TPR) repeat protein